MIHFPVLLPTFFSNRTLYHQFESTAPEYISYYYYFLFMTNITRKNNRGPICIELWLLFH